MSCLPDLPSSEVFPSTLHTYFNLNNINLKNSVPSHKVKTSIIEASLCQQGFFEHFSKQCLCQYENKHNNKIIYKFSFIKNQFFSKA
jgi:hypothetical protein